VAAEDCKPNKSLRTTIKVFLRTEEKKREALRLKDLKNTPPDTPATPATPVDALATSTLLLEPAPSLAPPAKDEAPQLSSVEPSTTRDQGGELVPATEPVTAELPTEAQQDIPQPSIEVQILNLLLFSTMLTLFRKLHLAKNQQKMATRLLTKLEMVIRRWLMGSRIRMN